MKNVMIAGALALLVAVPANAQDMFATMEMAQDEGSSQIVLNPFSASSDGYVAIYDNHRGEIGNLLGVASIKAGANRETRIGLGHPVRRDVIALLFAGGDFMDPSKAIDSVKIDIEN